MTHSLFEVYGIEIESTVVDAETLDVRPIVDELLRAASGAEAWVEDVEDGAIGYSNELVDHVVELKTAGPVTSFDGLATSFRAGTARLDALLAEGWGARLMPTGMHPWMNPRRETRLWPHETGPVYAAYDRLFDCRRHGWANLQSVHLNLPFADEDEFGRLMAAVRVALPLIPALAASSPVVEGRAAGALDERLRVYARNAEAVPAMAGRVIPEPIFGFEDYREQVLGAIDTELRRVGADEVLLGQEWTNARGAIARFERMALEIRLIDAQECARGDLAVAAAVAGVVRALVDERWSSRERQAAWSTDALAALLAEAAVRGPATSLPPAYAALFGPVAARAADLGVLWRAIGPECFEGPPELEAHLERVLATGTLAERILLALDGDLSRERLRAVYGELCDCLSEGRTFLP